MPLENRNYKNLSSIRVVIFVVLLVVVLFFSHRAISSASVKCGWPRGGTQ